MLGQGLFEIAARTYRNRASVAASLDEDDAGDAGEFDWDMETDDDTLELAAASNGTQLQSGGQELRVGLFHCVCKAGVNIVGMSDMMCNAGIGRLTTV